MSGFPIVIQWNFSEATLNPLQEMSKVLSYLEDFLDLNSAKIVGSNLFKWKVLSLHINNKIQLITVPNKSDTQS